MALQQPKKPAGGAFGQFMAEKRATFIKQCEGKPITEVSKIGGAAWKALSAAEQAPYQKKYEAAKAKYAKDFEAFIAAGGVKEKGAAALRSEKRKAKEGKMAKKDPNKPKKPAGGAFGCYLDKHRPALINETKGQPITAVTKLASTRWKALSEADKAPFEAAYKKKKAAYEEAMKSYVPPAVAETPQVEEEDEEDDEDDEDDENEEDESEDEEESPPAKKSKKEEAPPAKQSKKAETVPAKGGKDADAFAQAKKEGYERQLKTLLEKPEVQQKKLSASAVLKALQAAGGKTIAAKKALVGGA